MVSGESVAQKALREVSRLMDYELMISRPGVSEPDSDFIWASTFRAPVGISFLEDDVMFNLFLPEGSEDETDKKLFLKRVGAKLQDGIWQVRRSHTQLKGSYGPAIKMAVSSFKTAILDYSYINRGRTFVHFVFNESELELVSSAILSVATEVDGIRIEYLKRTAGDATIFSAIDRNDEVSSVTIEAVPLGTDPGQAGSCDDIYFVIGNFLDPKVKVVSTPPMGGIPEIMESSEITEMGAGVISFYSENQMLMSLIQHLGEEFVVVYGSFGSAGKRKMTLTINVPSAQTSALMRVLNKLVRNSEMWNIKLREITYFQELLNGKS